ncbi:MAG: SRPBCC family protein [Saprospiraceae bacterium]
MESKIIEVSVTVKSSLDTIWECWSDPKHIVNWNFASDDWCAPRATVDLRSGGSFLCRMEAKDGSMGFDFNGIYDLVQPKDRIEYTLEDGRMVSIHFMKDNEGILVVEKFEAENENSLELQQTGWQAILNNFKQYVESIS